MAYGLLGLPLAFAALPLYVILPNHYAREFGVPLATLGALLLAARLFDALVDPAIGRYTDGLFARSSRAVLALGGVAALVLFAGFCLLFFPQVTGPDALALWAGLMLLVTYAGYSTLSIAHQSWGAMLGGNEVQRSRVVAWREGLGLLGVVTASVLPSVLGLGVTAAAFGVMLLLGWLAWSASIQPAPAVRRETGSVLLPFREPAFRRLLAVFMLNGIASAVPATLVLFFIQDRLQAPSDLEPIFLGSYFLAAALSIPLWLVVVKRLGLARTWLVGMLISIAVFAWASQVAEGQFIAFGLICALSGVALGTDLALPGALLAGVIQASGQSGRAEGAFFGWWNFATKLNLALAAGLALPLLGAFGYVPGTRDAQALGALVAAYCLLPCLLKLAAAACLYVLVIRSPQKAQPR
ncbi:MAG: MFS transporter [Pseudomonadota bacterium]